MEQVWVCSGKAFGTSTCSGWWKPDCHWCKRPTSLLLKEKHSVSDGCVDIESHMAGRTCTKKSCPVFTMRLLGPRVPHVLTSSSQPHVIVLGNPVKITAAQYLKEARLGLLKPNLTSFMWFLMTAMGPFDPQQGTVTQAFDKTFWNGLYSKLIYTLGTEGPKFTSS